jgi:nitrogen PTS system EIIA component
MLIKEILSPQCTLSQARISSKKKGIELLCDLIGRENANVDPQDIYQAMIARERLGSTGIGQGIALPHGRVKSDHPVAAMVHLVDPIDFDATDEQPVDLLFGLAVPEKSTDEHLQILAKLAKIFRNPKFCAALRDTSNDQDLYDLIIRYSEADETS